MKRIIVSMIVAFTMLAMDCQAQISKAVTPTKTPLTLSADTAYAVLPIDNTVISIEMRGVKTSGTVGGKIYLLGLAPDGTNWDKLDSLSIANVSTQQYKIITMASKPYIQYKFQYLSTGGTWVPTAHYV